MIRFLTDRLLQRVEKNDEETIKNQVLPDGVGEISDVAYINDGNPGHLLDIYYPENAHDVRPAVIVVHGGGFLYGDKNHNRAYGYHLAIRGFIVFNINYRLATNGTMVPGQVQDVISAINWISDNLSSIPADCDRMFLAGDSAGGTLAVMSALISKSERLRHLFKTPKVGLDIKAIALHCGLMCVNEGRMRYRWWRRMCFDKGYKNQEYYQSMIFEGNPEIKNLPPVFMTSGDDDEIGEMTLRFKKVLKKNGIKHKMKYFDKTEDKRLGHVFCIKYPDYDESVEILDEQIKFFMNSL